jgi:hypothetical protein
LVDAGHSGYPSDIGLSAVHNDVVKFGLLLVFAVAVAEYAIGSDGEADDVYSECPWVDVTGISA